MRIYSNNRLLETRCRNSRAEPTRRHAHRRRELRSAEDAKRLADTQSAHVLNIKLAKSGVIGGQAIHKIAQDAGLGLMIGGMKTALLGFAAHFASGLGGFDWVDLDTPQLLSEDPIQNGTTFDGPRWDIKDTPHGHGASLAGIDLF